ncbi:MAG: hypothetical protein ACHQ5A_13050 [Opitutales bacterium]
MPKRVTKTGKTKIEPPFTVEMDPAEKEKLHSLQIFCQANRVAASKGCIVRALLENAQEGLEFLGMVRLQAEREKAAMMEKRGHATHPPS